MHGRMIHKMSGALDSQLYDRDGQVRNSLQCPKMVADRGILTQCINSIDRSLLNEGLLQQVASSANISLFFNHRVTGVDFDAKTMSIHDSVSNKDLTTNFDLCIGADGSYSIIRRQMMRVVR